MDNSATTLPDIMISYSSRDVDVADELCRSLESRSIPYWIDRQNMASGGKWHDQLISKLKKCGVLLVLLSENYLKSMPCRMEVFIARSLGKRVVPILIDDILEYSDLVKYPETKGLEDLFMFRIRKDTPSETMGYKLSRSEAVSRTINSLRTRDIKTKSDCVYIAYLSVHANFATEVAVKLQNRGINIWIATLSIEVGENFMQSQIAALLNASHMIVILDKGIEKSDYVRTELNLARAQGVKLLPVLTESTHSDPDRRGEIISALRSEDHTYCLYEIHAFPQSSNYLNLEAELHAALLDA